MKMRVVMPEYYPEFKCLADKCRYNCCQEWSIYFSRADYNRVRSARKTKEFQQIVQAHIKRDKNNDDIEYGRIVLNEYDKCPLLEDPTGGSGLCRLQVECGFTVLPEVCKTFPRIEVVTNNCLERVCSTGCEKVVQMLMDIRQPLRFVETQGEPNQARTMLSLKKSPSGSLVQYFEEIRDLCIHILQNRCYSLDHRMLLLGLALQDLQKIHDEDDVSAVPDWLRQKRLLALDDLDLRENLDNLPRNSVLSMGYVLSLCGTIRDEKFVSIFKEIYNRFHIVANQVTGIITFELDPYHQALERLMRDYSYLLEHLLVNYLFEKNFPFRRYSIWDNYIAICQYYSFFKLIVSGYMTEERGTDDLIYILTKCSRTYFHATKSMTQDLISHIKSKGATDLAHMAVIVNG